jgi:hypothetical protein
LCNQSDVKRRNSGAIVAEISAESASEGRGDRVDCPLLAGFFVGDVV